MFKTIRHTYQAIKEFEQLRKILNKTNKTKDMYTKEQVVELFNEFSDDNSLAGNGLTSYMFDDHDLQDFLKEKGLIQQFEVGDWFYQIYNGKKTIFCKSEDGCYGFNQSSKWSSSLCTYTNIDKVKMSDKEVEEALIKEAKRRGFKEGVRAIRPKCMGMPCSDVLSDEGEWYVKKENELVVGNLTVFSKGKWGEIIEDKKEMTVKDIENELGYEIKIVK